MKKVETAESTSASKKPRFGRLFIIIPIVVLFFTAIGAASYFYLQYNSVLHNPQSSGGEKELITLVSQVGKLIVLPSNETPKLATVTDASKLKNQQFFRLAENGDKVLIYAKAQKAYLYRPSNNRVVEVGPISLDTQKSGDVAGASVSQAPKTPVPVTLYNGTTIVGLTKKIEKELVDKKLPITVVGRGNATNNTYQKTIVVDLTGKNKDVASTIAISLQGEVGSLPEGEAKPSESDILVILGANAQ